MLPRAAVSANRVREVLYMDPSVTDEYVKGNKKDVQEKGTLEFDQVTFSYPGAEEAALSGIHFKSLPGEVTAIIGGTGSGKSTLINLIPRFYDVSAGTIRINGRDIREVPQAEVRSKIGLVPQKAFLFTGTVAENIRYGREDATMDDIRRAAKIAQVDEFVVKMEKGYETKLTQGGTNLSGGQKQRLAIATALISRPDVYLFDDSFSALDYKTDAKLRQSLKEEVTDASIVIVGQRVSSVMDADRIIVLDQGHIRGIGTHEELLESSNIYQEIVKSQHGEEGTA